MSFFGLSFPIGTYFRIPVRVHFTLILFSLYFLQKSNGPFGVLLSILIIWGSILLHEFGHALTARWCYGDAHEIILWPLGGLAVCIPIFNPTAHLLTSAAGPFVSLCIYLIAKITIYLMALSQPLGFWFEAHPLFVGFIFDLERINLMLILFNLIPTFPMDGGRILRDALWHVLGYEKATLIAVTLSRTLAFGVIPLVLFTHNLSLFHFIPVSGNYTLIVFALFIFFNTHSELDLIHRAGRVMPFSIWDRLRHAKRSSEFHSQMKERIRLEKSESFHKCKVCGRTEHADRHLEFRVASDGEEYCAEHLPKSITHS